MAAGVIACRFSSYKPFEDMCYEHVASLGLRHVEIMVPPPTAIDQTEAELDRHGLTAISMHGECNVARADIVEQVRAQMSTYSAMGCRIMFVSVRAGETPLPQVVERLRAAGDVAREYGVTIALETHPDLATNGDVALRTMQAVNHPNVRINFDTANIYFYNENADCVADLRKVIDYVAAVHLKDTDGGLRSWHFPALGQGVVDFAGVFSVLDEAGFDGPCTLEIEGVEGEEKTPELVCRRVAESVSYLRKLNRL